MNIPTEVGATEAEEIGRCTPFAFKHSSVHADLPLEQMLVACAVPVLCVKQPTTFYLLISHRIKAWHPFNRPDTVHP